jgi:hypothetical protein
MGCYKIQTGTQNRDSHVQPLTRSRRSHFDFVNLGNHAEYKHVRLEMRQLFTAGWQQPGNAAHAFPWEGSVDLLLEICFIRAIPVQREIVHVYRQGR